MKQNSPLHRGVSPQTSLSAKPSPSERTTRNPSNGLFLVSPLCT